MLGKKSPVDLHVAINGIETSIIFDLGPELSLSEASFLPVPNIWENIDNFENFIKNKVLQIADGTQLLNTVIGNLNICFSSLEFQQCFHAVEKLKLPLSLVLGLDLMSSHQVILSCKPVSITVEGRGTR